MNLSYISHENRDAVLKYIKDNLSDNRQIHIQGVILESKKLASKWGANDEKAYIVALCHDLMRREELNNNITHGNDATKLMTDQFGITDKEILDAVRYHTTGRENMTLLEKIIYLADSIEPSRDYHNVEDLRELAYKDLDLACLQAIKNTINYVKEKNLYLDELTVLAEEAIKRDIVEF